MKPDSMNPGRQPHADDSRPWQLRPASAADWPRMREIFLEGIATGVASFETDETVPSDFEDWIQHKHGDSLIAAEGPDGLVGWAALAPASHRECYRGVAESQLYVAEQARGQGIGDLLLGGLIESSRAMGIWTIEAIVFPENQASRRLFARHGFREVGRREKIARMNGEWRDTLLLERRDPDVNP